MKKAPTKGERIFAPEIAKVARGALVGVVEGGTAGRLNGVYTDDKGSRLSVGGKTGTGDHRKQIWGAGGSLIESKFISRAATFTFFIGDRFFGVITAYVEGGNSGLYHFTSSLPVQIIKFLKPTLSPLVNNTLPVKEVTPPVVKVIMAENSQPVVKTEAVKVTKPLIEKPVVKVVKPQIENAVVKVPRSLIEKPVIKIAQPLVEKAQVQIPKPSIDKLAVKVAKPVIEKPVIKFAQPKIEKPVVNVINPLATKATVKVINPTIKAIEPKTTKVLGSQKITTTDRNDSATRYYKYPTTPALTQ
jgi:hypothetical protein